jgi:hypothetical protein
MNIEEFYSADERRRQSAEIELGTNWFDVKGNRYELSWVEDTGELYTMTEFVPEVDTWTPFGDIEVESMPVERVVVSVVGYFPDHASLEQVLGGWEAHMAQSDGITWVADQLRQHGVPVAAPV